MFFIQQAEVTKNSIVVTVTLGSSGFVHCTVYPAGSEPPKSSASVTASTFFSKVEAEGGSGAVTIPKLQPATAYDLYCATRSVLGTSSSYSEVIENKLVVSTKCCKTITVAVAGGSYKEGTDISDIIRVVSDGAPTASVNIAFTVTSKGTPVSPFFPNSIALTSRVWSTSQSVSLLGKAADGNSMLAPGVYTINAVVSGTEAAAFSVIYSGTQTFTILSASEPPSIPVLSKATFASNGLSMTVTFDSRTDMGKKVSVFKCSDILTFAGASTSSCQWISATTLTVTLVGTTRVNVNSTVAVVAKTIRASCNTPFTEATCASWGTVAPTPVLVRPPASPIDPVVAISGPQTIGPCDAPVFDFSASTGSGGREWTSVTVTVSSTTDLAGAAAAQAFFASSYRISPPTAVPSGTFNAGNNYDIQVKLCNFLGSCTVAVHRLAVANTIVPVVSILGQSLRSMVTSEALMLQAQGFTAVCGGSKVYTGLTYAWTVTKDQMVDTSLTNAATSPSKFRLDSYKLSSSSVYDITVTVTSTSTGLSSSASVRITVVQSDIVARIAGGSHQSVRQGASLLLDASSSYDADLLDRTDTSGLTFTWACSQIKPSLSSDCELEMDIYDKKITVAPSAGSTIGSVYAITVTVSGSTRSSSATVEVEITKPDAPVITVSKRNQAVKMNPSSELVLLGTIQAAVPTASQWSVDDTSINIAALARTPTSTQLSAGHNVFNLVLSSNSLVGKALPYVFSLTADGVTSSLNVLVNTAPSPGAFAITPTSGVTMDTKFVFTATEWSDVDIPISYEFGYLDSRGSTKVVRGRAEASFGTTTLAAGDPTNNYLLVCQVRVFDSLNAVTAATGSATVNMLEISNEDLSAKITSQLSASAGNVDSQKETLSVASSMLNTKDCSLAPDCDALNRAPCSATINTCGSCLSGYAGITGDDNSACLDPSSLSGDAVTCSSGADCSSWEECISGVCAKRNKQCTNDCSGHGVCHAEYVDNGQALPDNDVCLMGDESCRPVCLCSTGYDGSICQMTTEDAQAKTGMRNQLLTNLNSLANVDEPSADAVASWQSSLSSITTSVDELSGESSDVALSVASKILSTATDLSVSHENLLDVLSSVDSATIAKTKNNSSTTGRRRLTELTETISLLDSFTSIAANSMVSGQDGITTIHNMFRTATAILQGGSLSVPLTDAEAAAGASASSCALQGGSSEQKVSIVSLKAKIYDDPSLTSNAVRVRLVDNNLDADVPMVTLVIQNSVQQSYVNVPSVKTVNATCEKGDYTVHEHICPGGPAGDLPVYLYCNGTAGLLSMNCPSVAQFPECKLLQDGLFGCEVVASTSTSVTCECSVSPDENGKRRKLSALDDSGALEVAAVSTMVVTEFGATMSTADEFNSLADVEKTLTVLLMYGILWAAGLMGICICSVRHTHERINADATAAKLEKRKQLAESTRSSEDIRNYLSTYVNEIFPSVFQPTSGTLRLWNEISKHHRYLLLFTAKGKNADKIRMITGIHLLTIQSMLMFILALCYDLQFPDDDGTCATYTSRSSCLREKSVFNTQASVCDWSVDEFGDASCRYVDTDISIKAVVIISIVIAVFTAPINLLVDFCFIEILSAPSPDTVKAATADTAMRRTMRRVSNVGRRMSAVAASTAASITRAGRSTILGAPKLNVDTTRLVPDAAAEAQMLAAHSVGNLLEDARSNIDNRENLRKAQRQQSSVLKVQQRQEEKQKKYSIMAENSHARQTLMRRMSLGITDEKLKEVFAELCVDMTEQRKVLKRSQQDGFDMMWGVDPTGEFSNRSRASCLGGTGNAEAIILKELKFVREEVQAKFNKLRFASDVQTGVEILHLFVLDLLGRDTPVAKIFLTKSEEDFRHSMVVANWVKALTWCAVAVINLYFVYFSMLRGLERGQRWQTLYLVACIVQFVIEMLFYETSECAFVHYFIPNLARNEVQAVSFTLHQAVQKICSNIVDNVPMILDAPRYLFVSTNLAQRFPDLLESVIVQSYHTYSPGELSHKWKVSNYGMSYSFSPWARSNARVRQFTLSAVVISLLQHVGAMSPSIQRVFIHTAQPLVVSAFVLVLMLLVANPLYFIIIAPLAGYKIYTLVRDWRYHGLTRVDSKLSDVHPGSEEGTEDAPGVAADIGRVRLDSRSSRASSLVHPDDDDSDLGDHKAEDIRVAENAPIVASMSTSVSTAGPGPVRVPAGDMWTSCSDEDGNQIQMGQVTHVDSDDSMDLIAQLASSNFDVSSEEEEY